MKTGSTKSIAKEAHASERKNIKQGLIKELKTFAARLGHNSKKIEKAIEKHAKQLAKKLAKPGKTHKPAAPKAKADNAVTPKVSAETKAAPVVIAPKLVAVNKKPAAPAKNETAKPVAVKKTK